MSSLQSKQSSVRPSPCVPDSFSGNEIGPFKAVEESILAGLVHQDDRSTIFAWYAAISGFGASVGSLSAGWIIQRLTTSFAWGELSAYRLIFGFYSALALMKAGLTMGLSEACELSPAVKEQRIAPETERMLETETTTTTTRRSVMARVLNIQSKTLSKLRILALLFGLDNFASGLVPLCVQLTIVFKIPLSDETGRS